MRLSAPLFQLKRRARLMARANQIPLHQALDDVARAEGFAQWSLLSSRLASSALSETIVSQLTDGELLLLAGRPGHGKTTLGLQLLLDAARARRKAVLFTLEWTEQQARQHIALLDKNQTGIGDAVEIVTSDDICADVIIRHLSGLERGTVAVVDYLQLLDQKRSNPELSAQVHALGAFAKNAGVTIAFISQIDRSFDPQSKPLPDFDDLRLPNRIDLNLFSKACFLHNGEAKLRDVA